ncbi:MAG TPA: response regulator [Pyrinomonadaceae bacterium]|nr:response regulator [Pyrinomonadaceae bacterium]
MADILIVDDDDVIRDTLKELLSEHYACQTAGTADEAFARLAEKPYDLVLTDISMPGISGFELLGKVLDQYPKTPVIVVSGISDQEHVQGLIKLGAFDFLLKPFRLEVVEKSVRRALEYRLKLIEASEKSEDSPENGASKIVDE